MYLFLLFLWIKLIVISLFTPIAHATYLFFSTSLGKIDGFKDGNKDNKDEELQASKVGHDGKTTMLKATKKFPKKTIQKQRIVKEMPM